MNEREGRARPSGSGRKGRGSVVAARADVQRGIAGRRVPQV
jgi:hypothetical protein